MANRDEILRQLIVEEIKGLTTDGIIIVQTKERYEQEFEFLNDRDIPDVGGVKLLIQNETGTPVIDKLIEKTGADVTDYELDLSAETDIPYPSNVSIYINKVLASMATWNFATKIWSGLPDTVSGDVIEAYYVGREFVAPPEPDPNTLITGMSFGSAAAIQSYLISKGNTGAIVSSYSASGANEFFFLGGINSLSGSTFLGSAITAFSTTAITGSIGSSCFASTNIATFSAPCTQIDIYAFTNCAALISLTINDATTIEPGAFQNATGLNGKTISLPALVAPNGLGGSPGNEVIFDGITGLTINVPAGFATNNSGSPDGDLAAVISDGGTVNYYVATVIDNGITSHYPKDVTFNITVNTSSVIFHDIGETMYVNSARLSGTGSFELGVAINYEENIILSPPPVIDIGTISVTNTPIY